MKDGGLGSLEPLSATWGKDISSPALVSPSVKQEVPVISDVLEESWLPLEHRVSLGVGGGERFVSRHAGALPSSFCPDSLLGCPPL